jgi:hypothetical protein
LVSNKSQTLTFNQLGGDDVDGLHFLGPIRGVKPISPNGLSTLNPALLSNPEVMAGMISYNYTLNNQGLSSNVSCSYQPTSPLVFASSNNTLTYNVPSCRAIGQASIFLTGVPWFQTVLGSNTLIFWACQSAPNTTQAPFYSIYLRGIGGGYEHNIGNITCVVSPLRPAIFPVTYHSSGRVFSAGAILPANESAISSPSPFSLLVNQTLVAFGGLISASQNSASNLAAEMVITFGMKSFKLKPYEYSDKYLRLFEQLIQGILEYEVCLLVDTFFT